MIQECIIIRTGADTFDVIVGHKLNDKPLSRAEADHLAHASASTPIPPMLPALPASSEAAAEDDRQVSPETHHACRAATGLSSRCGRRDVERAVTMALQGLVHAASVMPLCLSDQRCVLSSTARA